MAQALNRQAGIVSDTQESIAWYALRVRSRHEKKIAALLEQKNIEISLPLLQVTRQWSDRKKLIQVPLFRGYVFTRIPMQLKRFEVLQTTGAVAFSGICGKIKPIPDEQMYWLDQFLHGGEEIELESDFPTGQRVRVTHGPWRGIEGIVLETRASKRLVIWLDALMQGMSVNLDAAMLEPLNRERRIQ
jgi:transcription antitermination factor NusG